jgi:hypothetical protein
MNHTMDDVAYEEPQGEVRVVKQSFHVNIDVVITNEKTEWESEEWRGKWVIMTASQVYVFVYQYKNSIRFCIRDWCSNSR